MQKNEHNCDKSAVHVYAKTEVAKAYDKVRFESPLGTFLDLCEKSALLEIMSQIDATKVADIACGTGRFTFLMQELGYHVVGIDTSKAMLNIAKNRGSVVFVRASAFSLPFRNNVFDAVISFRFLWHVKQHVVPLKEFKRIGKYIIVDIKHTNERRSISPPGHKVYEHYFSTNELFADFYSAGLTIKRIIPIQMIPSLFLKRKTKFLIRFLLSLNMLLRKTPFIFLSTPWLVLAK